MSLIQRRTDLTVEHGGHSVILRAFFDANESLGLKR